MNWDNDILILALGSCGELIPCTSPTYPLSLCFFCNCSQNITSLLDGLLCWIMERYWFRASCSTLTSQSRANHIFHARSPVQKKPSFEQRQYKRRMSLWVWKDKRIRDVFNVFWHRLSCGLVVHDGMWHLQQSIGQSTPHKCFEIDTRMPLFCMCPPPSSSKFKRNTVQQISASTGHIHKWRPSDR